MTHNILIVNETPVAKDERCWLEARTLASAGYGVTVVCPKEQPHDESVREQDGVCVYAYAPPRQARGLWGYAWELAYCWARSAGHAIRLNRRFHFEVVHACNPPDTFFLLAAILKPFGKKFVFAQHDLVPELWFSRFGDRGLIGRILHRGLLGMERLSYLLADAVVLPNESYKQVAIRRGHLSPEMVFVVRNGPDLDKVMLVEPDPALRAGRAHLVCYLGIMNPQDGVDYLLRAIAVYVHDRGRTDTQFAMIGSGDIIDELKALARELAIEQYITFAGWVSDPDLLSSYLCTADVCVAPDPKTPLNELSSFMKIMDYMAAAKPIVAFDLVETRVSAGPAALYAVADDVNDFAAKMSELMDDPDRRLEMGQTGRRRIEESLSWTHQEPLLLEAYSYLLGNLSAAPPARHVAERSAPARTSGRPTIAVDSVDGKQQFLEFWGVPYVVGAGGSPDVSLLSAESWAARPSNAVVLLAADTPAALYRLDDGSAIYAPIRSIRDIPAGMHSVGRVLDERGRVVSHILCDPDAQTYYVPFSLDEAFDGFLLEKYASGRRFPPDGLLGMYYAAKPYLPEPLIAQARRVLARVQARADFPAWPADLSFESLKRLMLTLLLKASRGGALPIVWFWPEQYEYCLVLTHDVEKGLTENPGIWRLIDAERGEGFKSSFNVVPFKYDIDLGVLDRLRAAGCEVGVHGYSHDGKLFRDREHFPQRVAQVNEVGRSWGATGFRSSSTYRDTELFPMLEFDYDMSFFDTDPYEPQPGGCLSLFPYFLGDLVEIPMTLAQDHTLFMVLQEKDARVWREKLALVRSMNGLLCLNAHPDEGYVGDEEKVGHYLEFLRAFDGEAAMWNPLPGELARWWRTRRSARITGNGSGLVVEGGAPGMVVRWASLDGDELTFGPPAEVRST